MFNLWELAFSNMPAATIILGCDPGMTLSIFEDNGSLLFLIDQPAGADPVDIAGIFFDLNTDSTVESLAVSPFVDTTQVTGFANSIDTVDTLSNGASVPQTYDVGVQFGSTAGSTSGEFAAVGFNVFSTDGAPLTIDDLDLTNIALVVDSDTPDGQVLTVGGPGEVLLEEDFDDIHDPDNSKFIVSDDHWDVNNEQLHTDGCKDGKLVFEKVATDKAVAFTFDIYAKDASKFDDGGHFGDTFKVEVNIDGKGWVLLDQFVVDPYTGTFTGSFTGQTFGEDSTTLTYDVDGANQDVQFRFDNNATASDEQFHIDNVKLETNPDGTSKDDDDKDVDDFYGDRDDDDDDWWWFW